LKLSGIHIFPQQDIANAASVGFDVFFRLE